MRFDVCPEILSNPFHVSIIVDDSIFSKGVYRNFHIFVSHNFTHTDHVKIDMLEYS